MSRKRIFFEFYLKRTIGRHIAHKKKAKRKKNNAKQYSWYKTKESIAVFVCLSCRMYVHLASERSYSSAYYLMSLNLLLTMGVKDETKARRREWSVLLLHILFAPVAPEWANGCSLTLTDEQDSCTATPVERNYCFQFVEIGPSVWQIRKNVMGSDGIESLHKGRNEIFFFCRSFLSKNWIKMKGEWTHQKFLLKLTCSWSAKREIFN